MGLAGLLETPSTASRSVFDVKSDSSLEKSRTPMERSRYSKIKALSGKTREKSNLESIDETPIQPKNYLGKSRMMSNRFQMSLSQGNSVDSLCAPIDNTLKKFDFQGIIHIRHWKTLQTIRKTAHSLVQTAHFIAAYHKFFSLYIYFTRI